jgi:hypothetical protein
MSGETRAEGPSDVGRAVIKTRKITSWQPNWSASGPGEDGTYVFQLVLDHGATEVVLVLTEDDADNLFDWLSDSDEAYYDLDREVIIFGARQMG